MSLGLLDKYSALECAACKGAGQTAPRCSACGYRVAPEHLVAEITSHTHTREGLVDVPSYPSGNPATGPTYWDTYVQTYTDTTYEVFDAAGNRRSNYTA